MGELSIKIKIGDREYPMRIDADEEERLRKAGRVINEKVRAFGSQFGIDDKQDLLAMVAFDILVEKLRSEEFLTNLEQNIDNRIERLDAEISSAINLQ